MYIKDKIIIYSKSYFKIIKINEIYFFYILFKNHEIRN